MWLEICRSYGYACVGPDGTLWVIALDYIVVRDDDASIAPVRYSAPADLALLDSLGVLSESRRFHIDGRTFYCGPNTQLESLHGHCRQVGTDWVSMQAENKLCRVVGPWLDTKVALYSSLDELIS